MADWDKKRKVIVVCGPTATGKTGLALALARAFEGEVVSADSMQVYRGLPIGTAALTPQQAQGVPYHLTGFLSPPKSYSVAQWLGDAGRAIDKIYDNKHVPVVCGGTGFYIEALVKGTAFAEEDSSPETRDLLYREWDEKGEEAMYNRLEQLDPERAAQLHPKDKKRVLRALEQNLVTGKTAGQLKAVATEGQAPYECLLLGLDYDSRKDLYAAIEARVDAMMAAGLLEEAEGVYQNRGEYKTAVQAIGYKELFPYFEGTAALGPCVAKLKQATRNYAKRQQTWFKRMEDVYWLPAENEQAIQQAAEMAKEFLDA